MSIKPTCQYFMKMLNINANIYLKVLIKILFILLYSFRLLSNESLIEIKGNIYTDEYAIFSLIENKPNEITEEYSNYLLKTLDNSMLFESVEHTNKSWHLLLPAVIKLKSCVILLQFCVSRSLSEWLGRGGWLPHTRN